MQFSIFSCRACYKSTFNAVATAPGSKQNCFVVTIARAIIWIKKQGRAAHSLDSAGIIEVRQRTNQFVIKDKRQMSQRANVSRVSLDQTTHFGGRLFNIIQIRQSNHFKHSSIIFAAIKSIVIQKT